MAISILLHIANEDAVACEIEELPPPESNIITVYNPVRRDGKDLHYLEPNVNILIVPFSRVNFIQVLPSEDVEEVIGFVRD
ncbi:MAG TPA: hypothetical protein VLL52_02585 [Anaerolineae bacterium]|nr:hypothetical protein [Anaerolineae bacterium]